MDIPRIARLIIGIIAVLMTGALLYFLWWLYAVFYLNRRPKPEPEPEPEPPPEIVHDYEPPEYIYDETSHEFFVKKEK